MLTRRGFLIYAGLGTYSLLRSGSALGASTFPLPRRPRAVNPQFKPIAPSVKDELVLAKGFHADLLLSYGDSLGVQGPHGEEFFGFDNDFIAYFPIDSLQGKRNPSHGLLWVNHEFVNPLFVNGVSRSTVRTREQILKEKRSVGGSIIEVKRDGGKWKHVVGSSKSKRFTADYPKMNVTGPVAAVHPEMSGTLANCSGGKTLWHTALSGEENYQLFNPSEGRSLNWGAVPEMAINEAHYGWIVEVDPFGELPPTKHTALGHFSHENAALKLGASGKVVIYMGDDANDQFLYKFVSSEKFKASASRKDSSALLASGTLYAGDFANGRWLPLDFARNKALAAAGFQSQADVLLRTREAAKAAGATPLDRPEDCEVNPIDGSVYVSLTNNSKHSAFHGQILRIVEEGDDAESETFRYEVFLAGGVQSGLSCPDNLVFDKQGNLWVTCDMASYSAAKGIYQSFGNNGLFMVPTQGAAAGDAFQFASGPIEAELTGPWFNDTFDTLFLSVQHPGEETVDLNAPTSRWPTGKGLPKSSIVAIQGFKK